MSDAPFRKHPAHLRPPEHACKHHDFSKTPKEYFEHATWVRNRYSDGERQSQCPKCKCWLFEEEMNTEKDTPYRLFNDLLQLFQDVLFVEVMKNPRNYHSRVYKDRIRNLKKRSKILERI